jgi:heme/copper-type cytochrome/quinol oxidase subunit 2
MAQFTRRQPAGITWLGGLSCLCLAGCGPSPDAGVPLQDAVRFQAADAAESIPDPLVIQLTGTEHRWQAVYPQIGDAIPVVQDLGAGQRLHLPFDTDVVLILKSTDYIYTLAIPELGLKQIAVPDLEFRMTFRPSAGGPYSLIGDELCGLQQSDQAVQLVAEPREQFVQFLERSQTKEESL